MGLREDFIFYVGDKPTYQAVYETLRDAIVIGRIPMGERLLETYYSRLFNVSRTPVRKALKKLENNGLAVPTANGGLEAKGLSVEGINNMFRLQHALESLAFPQVILNISDDEIHALLNISQSCEETIDTNITKCGHMNEEIHRRLYKISRFEGIMSAVDLAYGFVQGFNLLAVQDRTRQVAITAEHKDMLLAVEARDTGRFLAVSAIHLEACRLYAIQHYVSFSEKSKI